MSGLVWNVQGSSNSEDIDVVVVVPLGTLSAMSTGSVRRQEASYAQQIAGMIEGDERPVDVNLVEASDGVICSASKGRPSKVNNAVLSTYELHSSMQAHPCIVSRKLHRNVLSDSVLSAHYVFTGFTRTASGCSQCDLAGCGECNLYNTIIRKSRYSCVAMLSHFKQWDLARFVFFNHGKNRICDMLKNIVFQLCQSCSFLDGREIFTKNGAIDEYPEMAAFIRRQVHDTENKSLFSLLNKLKNSFCDRLLAMLSHSNLQLLPASAFELSEEHQQDVAMVLRDGYDAYVTQCSASLQAILLKCPFKCTNAKNMRKYLVENQVSCVAIHTVIEKTHEVKICIALE